MGDVMSLIEKAESLEIEEAEAEELARKLQTASFNLEDFRKQLRQIKKLGPLTHVLDMIPGMNQVMDQVSPQDLDRQVKSVEAIINSMTPRERQNPRVLNAARRKRIAAGSGTSVQNVNQLMRQFQQMQHMMQKLAKQKNPNDIRRLFRR
jgi:signal recognition particle subunit SRP54